MEKHIVHAEPRTEFKKGPVGRLRRAGKIPAIIYGHTDPTPVTLDAVEFGRVFRHVTESTLLTLKEGKNEREVLIKAWDDDNRTGDLIHVDFYEVEAGKTLHTRIPVHLQGDAPGEREGGVLQTTLHEIEIECLPKDIPEGVTVDVSELQIGDAIHLSDISAPEGVTFLTSEDQVVVQVTWVREEPEEVEEEELEGEEGEFAEEGAEGEEGEASEESEEE